MAVNRLLADLLGRERSAFRSQVKIYFANFAIS